ncbi:MAG TPA: OmpA family protein [Steroidobacteraceae bacterium]|jgi:outer membrane protein OmpA-like peptidoglycan-associated protein|nr:OmpA family protein [Steroidobacteraceae bacterium]
MNAKLLTGIGLALALGACATTRPPNPALESARAAVQSAEADPNVNKYAPLDLDRAKKELAVAEQAEADRREAEVNQPAYLAAQDARIAQAHGAAKADDARVDAGRAERDRIMLAARTREAENAKADAADSKAQAAVALNQRDEAAEETARVQAELDALKATPTPRGLVLTLGDVMFDTGKSELKSGGARKIDQLAQFLMEHQDRRVQIDGFTDSVGSDAYNEELSQRRADSVKAALVSRGVDPSRIGTEGYGKAYPVAGNNDSGGRQLNRRVEVVIGNRDNSAIAPRSGL